MSLVSFGHDSITQIWWFHAEFELWSVPKFYWITNDIVGWILHSCAKRFWGKQNEHSSNVAFECLQHNANIHIILNGSWRVFPGHFSADRVQHYLHYSVHNTAGIWGHSHVLNLFKNCFSKSRISTFGTEELGINVCIANHIILMLLK